MATVRLGQDTFDEFVARDGIVLVDFWASWCGPCRFFAPVFEAASERHPEIGFGKIDTEAEHQLAARFEVMSIPTLMVLRDRVVLYQRPGALPAEALEELIGAARALDMDEVRSRLAQPAASS